MKLLDFLRFVIWVEFGFWKFNSVMYNLQDNDKWFTRAFLASIFLCTGVLVEYIKHINKG